MYEVILNFHLGESLATLDQLIERVVGTYLEQDVYIFMVFKHMLEFSDMSVVERFVDLDFGDELYIVKLNTFCLALDRFSVLLGMILAASTFLVSKLFTS